MTTTDRYCPVLHAHICPWYAHSMPDHTQIEGEMSPVTDKVSKPTARISVKVKLAIAIAVVVVGGFIVILVFAASSRVANAFTAGGTISLAAATVWLGLKTRDAVLVNEREMDQNKDLLALTRQQAESATQSARILSESSRPFVVPRSEGPIWVALVDEHWSITFPLWNYGTSIAILEIGDRRPKLLFSREGVHAARGKADSVIIPKESGVNLSFSIDPKDVARAGGPVTRPDGTYIAAVLEFWFTDSAKNTHYMVHAEFDAEDAPNGHFVTLLRLTNIEFGAPTVFGSGAITIGNLRTEPPANRE